MSAAKFSRAREDAVCTRLNIPERLDTRDRGCSRRLESSIEGRGLAE